MNGIYSLPSMLVYNIAMSLFASIDVGSNTIRLLIGRFEGTRILDIFSDRRITRLGNKVAQAGLLQDENMDASIAVLGDYASLISKFGVRHVKAVATSALRDASNADIFIKKVFDTTGISIQVISGRKEAEFTLRGVLSSLAESALRVPHSILIIDMGGGSTEWILCRDEDHVDMGSIPTGVINLTQKFIRTDPVSDNDVNALNHEIIAVLADLNAIIGPYITSDTQLIGTAGTFTTIASVDLALDTYSRDRIHLHIVSLPRLRGIGEDLLTRSLEERKRVRGLEAERADLIIPGILFTIDIMQVFRFDELIISDYGLLEGVLFEIKETVEKSISEAGQS